MEKISLAFWMSLEMKMGYNKDGFLLIFQKTFVLAREDVIKPFCLF